MKLDLKNKLLLGSILLMLFCSYKMALQKTVTVWHEYKDLEMQVASVQHIPEQMIRLTQKEIYYDSLLARREFGSHSFQHNLLKTLNEEVQRNGVQVLDFKQPLIAEKDATFTETYRFGLRGGYTAILKTLYHLEQKGSYGAIVHIGFKKEKSLQRRQENLEAVVFLQHQQ
ncbi:hypothetical protein U1E44_08260 [Arenibacter sp. GZD96]|uniref:hypothetical protein n=1 Tax=Aurantibrevibacter litoralis TaxID=3106030 RepID=UPI002AFF7CB1|nr:hypothetical protein [Arenibacter sp. GZD-96]MEA1786080.1 hypothetical protein [Arenibacter sp. GZD-96]